MVIVLAELGLARLAGIPGLTAVGAAAVLAETGGSRRYDSSSSLVKHAGLSPSENASGVFPASRTSPVAVGRACGWPSGARYGRCSGSTP
jgi:transposase